MAEDQRLAEVVVAKVFWWAVPTLPLCNRSLTVVARKKRRVSQLCNPPEGVGLRGLSRISVFSLLTDLARLLTIHIVAVVDVCWRVVECHYWRLFGGTDARASGMMFQRDTWGCPSLRGVNVVSSARGRVATGLRP